MSNQPLTKVVVVIVECDGAVRCERWTPTEGSLLEPLSKAVGGLIDVVSLDGGLDMWVNDEGLYRCEPNPYATLIARSAGAVQSCYYGPTVFTGAADQHGNTLGLPETMAATLIELVSQMRQLPETVEYVRQRGYALATPEAPL